MGLVISTTPATNSFGLKLIKRQTIRHAQDVVSNTEISILQYYPSEDLRLLCITLKPVVDLAMAISLPEEFFHIFILIPDQAGQNTRAKLLQLNTQANQLYHVYIRL